MNYRRASVVAAVVVAIAGATGCSGEPKLVPITGTIKVNGKPTKGVCVYFTPKDPKAAKSFTNGIGVSDENGRFTLMGSKGEGVSTGEYRVTFSRALAGGGKVVADPRKKPDETGAKESLSDEYTKPELTKTFATVTEKDTDFTFDILSK